MLENNSKKKITALAITFNNEESIASYIESLSFADEIIFVDQFSTDNTMTISEKLGVRMFQKKGTIAELKDFLLQQSTHNWISFFDINDVINPELKEEITEALATNKAEISIIIKRDFLFFEKKINYGGWYKNNTTFVFNKTNSLKNKSVVLKNHLLFKKYKSFDNYNSLLDKESLEKASLLYAKNVKPNFYHFFIIPILKFNYTYIIKLGFLDGKEGFILSYLHSFSEFKKYLQLWLMYRKLN